MEHGEESSRAQCSSLRTAEDFKQPPIEEAQQTILLRGTPSQPPRQAGERARPTAKMPGAECCTDRQRHTQSNGDDQGRIARRRPAVVKPKAEFARGLAAAPVANIADRKVQGGDQQEAAPE